MRPKVISVAVAAVVVLLSPAGAAPTPQEVNIEFSDYRPSQLDILPGEKVSWTNVSQRTHTVTSDTGLFDSSDVLGGGHFTYQFTEIGSYHYHCTIHPSIVGEIDVRPLTLGPLPTAAVAVGTPVDFAGRTADPTQPVTIQSSTNGSKFTTIATATPEPDGSWKTTIKAATTGEYRAASAAGSSQTRRLLVGIRRVRLHATPSGVSVSVTPSSPYSRILIEIYQRERFGWWPIANGRVDYVSEAEVRIRHPSRVRVVLVDKDGWTPIATSPAIVVKGRP